MKRKDTDKSRRDFLRNAVATGVAAGAASTAANAVAGVLPEETEATGKETGYRLTEHVQAYYKSFTR